MIYRGSFKYYTLCYTIKRNFIIQMLMAVIIIAGNIDDENDENPNLPVTTIANNIQEDNERIGVGRGGTGNYKRPPPASRFLPGHPGTGRRSNASRGSASSCHHSAASDVRPYSPPRPSNGSFATGRSIQHATTRPTGESTMPSSTAVAQFRFDFTEPNNEHNNNLNERSQSPSTAPDNKTHGPLRQQQQGEYHRDHQYHSLETSSITELNNKDSNGNLSAASFPAPVTTTRKSFSATQPKNTPIELTALPQVQPADPPPSMSPAPLQSFSSPISPKLASSGTVDPTNVFLSTSAIDRDEKFVCGRGGFANIAREADGTIRQHRSLVDYLASKRKKGSSSTSNKSNLNHHDDGSIDASDKKKSWWRQGRAHHQHIGKSVAGKERAKIEPVGVASE